MKKHKLGTSVLKIIEYVRVTGLPCMSDLHVYESDDWDNCIKYLQ